MNPEKFNFENRENDSQIKEKDTPDKIEKQEKEIPEINVEATKKEILNYDLNRSRYENEGKKDKADACEKKVNELIQRIHPDQKLSKEMISNYKKDIHNESLIKESYDFRQLYRIVADNEIKIVGSNNDVYDTETLLKLIGDVAGGKDLRYLPRSLGLREKVKELLNIDKTKKELNEISNKKFTNNFLNMNIEKGPREAEMPEDKKEVRPEVKKEYSAEERVKLAESFKNLTKDILGAEYDPMEMGDIVSYLGPEDLEKWSKRFSLLAEKIKGGAIEPQRISGEKGRIIGEITMYASSYREREAANKLKESNEKIEELENLLEQRKTGKEKVTEKDKEAQDESWPKKMETFEEAFAGIEKDKEEAKERHFKRFTELNNVWKELITEYGNDASVPGELRETIAKKRQEINNEYELAKKLIKATIQELEEKRKIEEINKIKEKLEGI